MLGHEPWPDRAVRKAAPTDLPSLSLTCKVVGPRYIESARMLGEAMGVSLDVSVSSNMSGDIASAGHDGSVDMFVIGWLGDYPDPDATFSPLFHSKLGALGALIGCDEVDRLIERGRRETEADVRREIYRELEETIRRRALVLPLWHSQHYVLFDATAEGVESNLFAPTVSWEKLSLRYPASR
jgi:ABC-type oligopeptide transport system substrate-binding subunit